MAEMPTFSRWMVNLRNARKARAQMRALAPHLGLPDGARLLELGAGRGGLSALLFEKYHPARLVVTDYDPDQVRAAQANLERRWRTLPPGVTVERADALALSFEAGAFDAVFAMDVLHHVEADHYDYVQRPAALREVRRVLAPGGRLVFAEFSRVPEVEATLRELGFAPEYVRRRWPHRLLAIYRAVERPGFEGRK